MHPNTEFFYKFVLVMCGAIIVSAVFGAGIFFPAVGTLIAFAFLATFCNRLQQNQTNQPPRVKRKRNRQ